MEGRRGRSGEGGRGKGKSPAAGIYYYEGQKKKVLRP